MSDSASDLNLLMVHADDHAPVLPDGLAEQAARGQDVPDEAPEPSSFWDEGGDPNDLGLQRWGVIAPQGPEGDRLLALVEPLMRLRGEQQGDPEVKVYRVPPRMTADEAYRWKKQVFDAGADLNIELPRYQLILGDLDQVPLTVQQAQQSDGYVGRLAFADDDGYAAYVDKVLRHERRAGAAVGDPARSLFFTVHDGTAATGIGHRALIGPGVAVVRRRQASGQYPAREILELGDRALPAPDELLRAVSDPDPAVLFTLSHGEGAPRGGWRSYEEQRRRQGAMSFGREGHLVGEALAGRPFLPGGIWFMLACYGAGTPSGSAYRHWLAQLAAAGQFRGKPEAVLSGLPGAGEPPFIAALPKAVLASSDGPLAFMGHVDLAWTYSFQELDAGTAGRPARFMAVTRSLLKRDRCGIGLRELVRYFDQTNGELTALYDQEASARARAEDPQVDAARRGHLWMLRQDLAAYVLLGDPAVRLPTRASAEAAAPRPIEVHSAPEAAPADAGASPTSAPTVITTVVVSQTTAASPIVPASTAGMIPGLAPAPAAFAGATPTLADAPIDAIEEALAHVLLAERTLAAIAARIGVSRVELERMVAAYRDRGRAAR